MNAKTLAAVALSLLVAACMTVRIDETKVFHPPSARGSLTQEALAIDDEAALAPASVTHGFIGEGDARLAFTIIRRGMPGPLVAVCGGNANDRQRDGVRYASRGLPYGDVLLFDYPGYGDSGGEASEASMKSMLMRVSAFAVEQAGDRPLVLWGHSLGGFVCSQLAGRLGDKSAGLVIETSARNVTEVARSWTPWYAKPVARIDILPSLLAYDSGEVLKAYDRPILVLGALQDKTLEVKLARSLAKDLERRGRNVTYVEFPDAEHGDVPKARNFRATMDAFFGRIRG